MVKVTIDTSIAPCSNFRHVRSSLLNDAHHPQQKLKDPGEKNLLLVVRDSIGALLCLHEFSRTVVYTDMKRNHRVRLMAWSCRIVAVMSLLSNLRPMTVMSLLSN